MTGGPETPASHSRRVIITLAVLAIPPAMFLLGLLGNYLISTGSSQLLHNSVSMSLAYGLIGSIFSVPLTILGTIWNFRGLTPTHQVLAVIFGLMSAAPLLLMMLYLYGISQIH